MRQLRLDAAALQIPVRLQGVITYYDVTNRGGTISEMAFIQDETGGICLNFGGASPNPAAAPIAFGDRVEVDGCTKAGKFSPSITGPQGQALSLRRLGRATPPAPLRPPLNRLFDPSLHDQWIEINAVLTPKWASSKRPVLHFNTGGLQFQAILPEPTDLTSIPASWLNKELRLRGVYSAVFNQRGQQYGFELYVQSAKQINLAPGDATRLFAEQAVPIRDLMRFSDGARERVRVKGIVVLQIPGISLYLGGEDTGLMVQTTARERLQRGQAVEVVGSPAPGEFGPCLRDAIIRAGEPGPAPEPVELLLEQALTADHEARLVRARARLVKVFEGGDHRLILLQSGKLTFNARLLFSHPSDARAELIPGSWLELTGICSLNARDDWTPIDPAQGNYRTRQPNSFTLLVDSPADVKVLRLPSWWTVERVAWLAGGVGLLALLAFVWVALLRYRVGRQTHLVAASLQREGIREERARIARDLHDTLQQNLTGILLQTNSAIKRLAVAPDRAAEALELVRSMARHSLEEVRYTVLNLRASELDYADLEQAVRELLTSFGQPNPPRIRWVLPETACRLPGIHLNHLLNFIREAVTNAVRHATARNIDVRIARHSQSLEVAIADDGKGFEATGADHLNTGRFGLHGMRERALKMNAQHQIVSSPGRGTTVTLTLPLPLAGLPATGKPA